MVKLSKLEQEKVIKNIPDRIEAQTKYFPKIRLAYSVIEFITKGIKIPKDVILYLNSNPYYLIRKIGYSCLNEENIDSFIDIVTSNYKKYKDDVLDILLKNRLSDKTIKLLNEYLESFYEIDYLSFRDRIARNNILIKLADQNKNKIDELRKQDSISYIYIMKSIHQFVDTDYLFNMFYSFEPRKLYLIDWYIELGNIDAVEKIALTEFERK
jgi:hypothetical protein